MTITAIAVAEAKVMGSVSKCMVPCLNVGLLPNPANLADLKSKRENRMKQPAKLLAALAMVSLAGVSQAFATEITCGSTGGMNRCPLPGADQLHVKLKQVLEGNCVFDKTWWADSDGVVVDGGCNAVFSYKSAAAESDGTDAKASAYYDDGCKMGKQDKKAGLSMAYERHEGMYDTEVAGSFQAGYEKCWMKAK